MVAIVLGSTGYTGELLVRLLHAHPHIECVYALSQSRAGQVCSDADPTLARSQKVRGYLPPSELPRLKADVLFSALPHLHSTEVWREKVGEMVIIDLAADQRVPDAALFCSRYGVTPPGLPADTRVAYGVPELYRKQIADADVIANAGCFPTAGLIPLVPLARDGLLQNEITIHAITGISGAGKSRDPNYLFSTRTENSGAYKAGTAHRHWIEFTHYLPGCHVQFIPHLAPLARGIAATISCRLRSGADEKDMMYSYTQAYSACSFVRVAQYDDTSATATDKGQAHGTEQSMTPAPPPQTAHVRGSNRCDFNWQVDDEGRVLIFSVIDNLMKGASGQAIQNMNVRFGFAEDAGLPHAAQL